MFEASFLFNFFFLVRVGCSFAENFDQSLIVGQPSEATGKRLFAI
jgi:hypothetical protein